MQKAFISPGKYIQGTIHNMPFTVTPEMIFKAILKTDKLTASKV